MGSDIEGPGMLKGLSVDDKVATERRAGAECVGSDLRTRIREGHANGAMLPLPLQFTSSPRWQGDCVDENGALMSNEAYYHHSHAFPFRFIVHVCSTFP